MILLTEQIEITERDRDNLIALAEQTPFDVDQIRWLNIKISNCDTQEQYDEIYKNVMMNIIERKDRIAMGFSYNMGDIREALRAMI